MNKKWIILSSIIAVLIIILPACWILVLDNSTAEEPCPQNPPSVFWQIDLDNFISDIVCDGSRVFVVDGVNVICFDKTDGKEIWRSVGIGGTTSRSKLVLYEDKIYAGTYGGVVTSFNKYTGKELLRFQAPVSTSWGGKQTPQDFFIADGRLLVYQNGYAVFNATTGELFYEIGWGSSSHKLGNASATASESNYVFMMGETRINPNNGEILWDLEGRASDPAVITQDRIVLWNYNPIASQELGNIIICLDFSGNTLWSYDVSSPMYQPTVYNGLVLFGAYDGNFYALQLSNGDLAWKSLVTNQNNQTEIIGNEGIHYPLTPVVSPIQIDTEKGIGVWGFAFIQNGWGGVIEYVGTTCGVNVATGQLLWAIPITNNASISGSNLLRPTSLGLALLNGSVFLTVGSDFYIIDAQTGNIFVETNYDHHLLEPTATNDTVFVAEELHLVAYK